MTTPEIHVPEASRSDGEARVPSSISSKLKASTTDELIALIERLAADSEEVAARVEYLTNPAAASRALQGRIRSIRSSQRFVSYRESREVAAELGAIISDIRADVLPKEPLKAAALAEKVFSLDEIIFNRADDSDGVIADELRAACVLWLDAAAGERSAGARGNSDWAEALYGFSQANDYGIREPLLEEAHRLLNEQELRALADRFERDARAALARTKDGREEFHSVITPSSAMGLLARALRDPVLYEQSIRIYSAEPNELQALDIASHYVACGDAAGALHWLERPFGASHEYRRLELMDDAYGLVGDRGKQIEIRGEQYRRAPAIHSYRALAELLPTSERAAFRTRALHDATTNPHLATAAELLFALEEPLLAERLIIERASELEGRNYPMLTALVEAARVSGRLLAATLLWRALLNAILARGYSKAYGHAARYLQELRAIAADIGDFCGHPSHADYETSLRLAHGRKASFWQRLGAS